MIYGGGNLNYIDVTTNQFKSDPGLGYHLGIAYKRGTFLLLAALGLAIIVRPLIF